MHPSQGAHFDIEGDVALHHPWIEAVLLKFSLTPASSKESPFILEPLGFDDESSFEFCFAKNHRLQMMWGFSRPFALAWLGLTAKSFSVFSVPL